MIDKLIEYLTKRLNKAVVPDWVIHRFIHKAFEI